jgi:ribonuclease inhibitor
MNPTARRIRIDGAAVATLAQAWDALAAALELPAHFGRNLDALHDCLTTDVPGPLVVEWRNSDRTAAALGADFARLRAALEEAAEARPDLRVRFRRT